MPSKRGRRKRSRRRKPPQISFFTEALISWAGFREACSEARYDFLETTEAPVSEASRRLDKLLQDVEICVMRLEARELQLDYENDYQFRPHRRPQRKQKKRIYDLKEANVLQFNGDLNGLHILMKRNMLQPKVARSVRKLRYENHDYVNAETICGQCGETEDNFTRKLNEAVARLDASSGRSGEASKGAGPTVVDPHKHVRSKRQVLCLRYPANIPFIASSVGPIWCHQKWSKTCAMVPKQTIEACVLSF